ncbi:hypothetical protein Dsin_002301 [Dipteronia sinensis]|uniref:Reverse transcriptase n=1 Tax=Dipteronia sinensis TaxID=43782 RepID=A0AAE0B6X9_9ROSI|nr:hypothetical protein Dsin_002301 [Dipteronia sinensis]
MINATVDRNELSGFKCSRSGPSISHLFFADDSLFFSKATRKDCLVLKRILDDYASASGQVVNFNKSALCVSNSVSSTVATELANVIGVNLVPCHERYLGLPSFAGRNKKVLFTSIKDQIWDKIKGWRDKLLSVGGKEILVKAVVQSIPTYVMSLFQLPKGLISEIHKMCARFWWRSSDTRRKIHWCSWQRMCAGKTDGGLGFRDLLVFNRALLAKQGWRLINNPDSLAARILKSCYFPDTSFLQAEVCRSGSMVWKGILWGRGILEGGSRWRIGDGSEVRIYHDRWLPRPTTFKTISPQVLEDKVMVSSLILASGAWNVPLIRASFLPEDADSILSLPLSSFRHKDRLQWYYENSGAFSVRSGYKVGLSMETSPSSSGLSGLESW